MRFDIQKIIEACGGELIAAHNIPVNPITIKRWKKRGEIPEKYWRRLAELGSIPLQAVKQAHSKSTKR